MKILLDTHMIIWMLEGNKNIPLSLKTQILKADFIFVSIASIWECAIKISIGKLKVDLMALVDELKNLGIEILPIRPEHLEKYIKLPKYHRDPFDRLLIAQAKTEPLILITADKKIREYF